MRTLQPHLVEFTASELARISHTPCGLRCSFGEADTASGGEKRIGAYGRAARRWRCPPKGNPKGRLKKPTGGIAALARCPTSRGARLLPCRLLEPAQATSSVRNAGCPDAASASSGGGEFDRPRRRDIEQRPGTGCAPCEFSLARGAEAQPWTSHRNSADT